MEAVGRGGIIFSFRAIIDNHSAYVRLSSSTRRRSRRSCDILTGRKGHRASKTRARNVKVYRSTRSSGPAARLRGEARRGEKRGGIHVARIATGINLDPAARHCARLQSLRSLLTQRGKTNWGVYASRSGDKNGRAGLVARGYRALVMSVKRRCNAPDASLAVIV